MNDPLLAEQIAYYRARANEYDEWWLRQGSYDMGPEANARWRTEADQVRMFVEPLARGRRVLELAGGTGIWSQHLARLGSELTVVDAAPEVLAINRARLNDPRVRYVQADLFAWQPDHQYDLVYFSFWLSHVPPEQFAPFWSLVGSCLAPAGQAVFVDSAPPLSPSALITTRKLNDGLDFQIYKRYYVPADLAHDLQALGWQADVRATDRFFVYGSASRPA